MNDPAASLWHDLELLDDALEPFTGPEIDERSSLRWMRRTLTERRAQIVAKIDETERSTLTVRVRSATGTSSVPLPTVTALLDAVQQALLAAGDQVAWPDALDADRRRTALTLEPGAAEPDDGAWQLTLQRLTGPFSAQPVTVDGDRLAIDAAMAAMLDALEDDAGAVGELAVAAGLTVELIAAPVSGDPRTVQVDRHTAA